MRVLVGFSIADLRVFLESNFRSVTRICDEDSGGQTEFAAKGVKNVPLLGLASEAESIEEERF